MTSAKASNAVPSIHQNALFGLRKVPTIDWVQERLVRIKARFADTIVANVMVRAMSSPSPLKLAPTQQRLEGKK
jgi:hypothetical protein